MRLYEGDYSWEVDQEHGSYFILHTTLQKAIKRAVEVCKDEMKEQMEYDVSGNWTTLKVEINSVEAGRVTKQFLCTVINSCGNFWRLAESVKLLATVTFSSQDKEPVVRMEESK